MFETSPRASVPARGTQPDTIAAPATPPGRGALAIVRISGPSAFPVLAALCPGLGPGPAVRRPLLSRVVDPETGEVLDRALVTLYRGPESYSGEDMVEISCHGGWLAPSLILDAALAAGARMAERGEFTRRAYLNGKMDLIQAEAVLDLVEGKSRALHGAALHHLERGLSRRIGGLRKGLIQVEALLMYHIDFPDEDEPPVPIGRIVEEAESVADSLAKLIETAPEGELLREGAVTVLAGRPNSGKSSLYNALLGEERAIVTEAPGTTRDALEAVVSLDGFPFRVVDTAGLRETGEEVERIGIEVARRYVEHADLILFCVEAGRPVDAREELFLEEARRAPVVLLRTKADLLAPKPDDGGRRAASHDAMALEGAVGVIETSVVTGAGLAELRNLMTHLVYGGLISMSAEASVVTRGRQRRELLRAHRGVAAFVGALKEGIPAEMASTHLRPAETALEGLLGTISTEDVLERVFREFCIGK